MRTALGRMSALRRRVALLSASSGRWSRRGREVLLGKQDLLKSATAPLQAQRRSLVTIRSTWSRLLTALMSDQGLVEFAAL